MAEEVFVLHGFDAPREAALSRRIPQRVAGAVPGVCGVEAGLQGSIAKLAKRDGIID